MITYIKCYNISNDNYDTHNFIEFKCIICGLSIKQADLGLDKLVPYVNVKEDMSCNDYLIKNIIE